jgi:hypothetical protein
MMYGFNPGYAQGFLLNRRAGYANPFGDRQFVMDTPEDAMFYQEGYQNGSIDQSIVDNSMYGGFGDCFGSGLYGGGLGIMDDLGGYGLGGGMFNRGLYGGGMFNRGFGGYRGGFGRLGGFGGGFGGILGGGMFNRGFGNGYNQTGEDIIVNGNGALSLAQRLVGTLGMLGSMFGNRSGY